MTDHEEQVRRVNALRAKARHRGNVSLVMGILCIIAVLANAVSLTIHPQIINFLAGLFAMLGVVVSFNAWHNTR